MAAASVTKTSINAIAVRVGGFGPMALTIEPEIKKIDWPATDNSHKRLWCMV